MFLFLAALYESFTLPVAVFLIVPIGIFGALVALLLRHTANDVFFQVSLITLVGLAGKNGILIVEFAKQRYEEGLSVLDAALEAARLRLRPIVMTSLAFILGVLPLVKATGAGAATQHSVGTGILGGMLAATLIGVFFTPLFYWTGDDVPSSRAQGRGTAGAAAATRRRPPRRRRTAPSGGAAGAVTRAGRALAPALAVLGVAGCSPLPARAAAKPNAAFPRRGAPPRSRRLPRRPPWGDLFRAPRARRAGARGAGRRTATS